MEGGRNVGEEWESVLGYGEGIADVGKKWGGGVWKSLWGECGGCGEVDSFSLIAHNFTLDGDFDWWEILDRNP